MSVAQTVPRGVPNALSHRTLSTKFLVLAGLLCVAPAFTSLSRPSRGPSVSQRASKVVISGAGPAGLLAARCILDRRPEANLEILEKRGDPRTEQISGFRAYSLGLNIRGRTALQHWEGLWERVSSKGVLSDKFLLHIGGQQLQLRANRPGSVPTLLIARNDLCAALLDDLEKHHGASASGRLSIHFGETLDMIDLKQHTCKTSQGREIGYDDLIGADGVNSLVRSALSTASAFRSESVDLPGQFKVWVGPCPKSMDPMAVHAMSSREYTLFSIPRVDGRLCTILSWTGEAPDFLENSDELIRQRIGADFPSFGPPELSAVEQLQAQRPSKATTIRANRYHDKDGHAMLLGDAAHSTGGTLGQGANSALADVVFLDQLLRKHDAGASVVKDIGEEFSAARQPEGLALWKLLQLPPKGPASVLYLASQGVAGLLSRLLDWLPVGQPPVQNLLSETTTPYSEIVSRNGFWIDMALQDAPGAEISSFGKNQTFYGWPETVAQWVELLLGALNSRPMPAGKSFCSSDHRAYVLYGQPVYLFGLLLCVFCPAHLLKHIRDFGMAEKPMDPRIKSGSKGAVACRFVLWDRSFCFLNCHLAATTSNSTRYGLRDLKQRLQQLEQCWTEIKFKSLVNQMVYPVPAHRAIFLMGDTNMRLVNRESKKDFHAYALQALGKPEGYKELWKLDQLSQEMADSPQPSLFPQKSLGCLSVPHERLLSQWREPFADAHQGPPFPPTFKLAVPGPGFSKKRVPAWTDRVLFSGEHAEPLKYGSVEQIQVLNPPHNVSDHDPVYAFFEVECMAIHPRRLGTLAREVRSATKEPREEPLARSPTTQLQALQQDQTFGGGMLATNQPDIDEISRKLYEQVTSLNDTGQSALACLMLQECQEECWKALCAQLEHKLGCSIRHIASSNSSTYPDLMDEEEEEVVKRLDSEALREGLREVLSSMQRDLPNSRPVTLLERRMVTSRKSSDNSLLSL